MEENQKLLPLKSDWVFKRIFSKKGNEDILANLLSAILNIEIKKVEIKNTELTKNMEKQKKSILDIKAELNDNSIIDIELQVNNEYNMIERDIQYLTKLYSEQLEEGEDYKETKKVVVINILDYNLCKRNTYHSIIHLRYEDYDKETYLKMYEKEETTVTDKLEIHIIELPKFIKLKNIKNNTLVEWLQLMSGESELIKMALSKNAEKIKKAYEELKYLSQDKVAREEYDAYQRLKLDEQMRIQYAEEKGKRSGIKKGEKNKSIEIARKMLKRKTDIKLIEEFTDLTEKEINAILI